VSVAQGEDRLDLPADGGGIGARDLGYQREVDQILGASAGTPTLVDAGVGVELFRNLQLERDGVDFDGLDPCKAEEILGTQSVGGQGVVVSETDIEQERLKRASRQGCGNTEPLTSAKAIVGRTGCLDCEFEEVSPIVTRRIEQRIE
jgi:hypothetical protein